MKTHKIYKILALALILVTGACSDDFLTVEPKGKVTSDDFLKNEEEAFMALMGVYDLVQYNYNTPWNSVFFVQNLPADDVNCAGSNDADQPPYQQIDDYKIVSDNAAITSVWSGFYKTISATNTIIERVQPGDDASMKAILAEAKALRAFTYFDLVRMFGDVPLMTVNPTSVADYHKPRTPKAEVYTQIEKDLNEAIADLPLRSQLSAEQKFRFAKGTAQALLGKVLLYQKKYDAAATQFENVINSAEYSLVANFGTIWDKEQELSPESLFEVMFTDQEGYDWGNFPWGGRPESNIHVQLMGPRDFFNMGSTGYINGWGFNLPTKKIADAFISAGDVTRRQATLMSEAELIAAGGSVKESGIHDYEGYLRTKYATKITETNTADGVVRELNYTSNWRIMRYADVLLMAAEAHALKPSPDATKANKYINLVRKRAGLSDVNLTGTALFNAIVTERQLELAFEGHRFFDLVRWGKGTEIPGFVTGKSELFPIPNSEITGNNAIDPEDQNPGY